MALEKENIRRRDECIQLRAILAQQSQSLRTLGGSANIRNDIERFHDEGELNEAFQAQKLVNRQLEAELTALTEENNAKLKDLSVHIDDLKTERTELLEILHKNLEASSDSVSIEGLQQNEMYLRYELKKSMLAYAELEVSLFFITNDLYNFSTLYYFAHSLKLKIFKRRYKIT